MQSLPFNSNRRLKLAIARVRVFGRCPVTLDEVRTALAQRRFLRQQMRFAAWLESHSHQLRHRFDRFMGRQAWRIITQAGERSAFGQFVRNQFTNN